MALLHLSYVLNNGYGCAFEYGVAYRDHQAAADAHGIGDAFAKGYIEINQTTGKATCVEMYPQGRDGARLPLQRLDDFDTRQLMNGVVALLIRHGYKGAVELWTKCPELGGRTAKRVETFVID